MSVPQRLRDHGLPSLISTVTCGRSPLFREVGAAVMLQCVLGEVMYETKSTVYAYVIMPDHLHLVISPPRRVSTSDVIRTIKGRFARRWNLRNRSLGSVWQPRFHERIVRSERALEAAVDYVHMNPVVASLAQAVDQYPWSSAYAPDASAEPIGQAVHRLPLVTAERSVNTPRFESLQAPQPDRRGVAAVIGRSAHQRGQAEASGPGRASGR
jgi:putative transposase